VRSETLTSMMFMIPTPPTSSDTPTTPVATTVIAPAIARNWRTNWSTASMRKLS
jgi:hypothetical protein